jgi:hypothetical protein
MNNLCRVIARKKEKIESLGGSEGRGRTGLGGVAGQMSALILTLELRLIYP